MLKQRLIRSRQHAGWKKCLLGHMQVCMYVRITSVHTHTQMDRQPENILPLPPAPSTEWAGGGIIDIVKLWVKSLDFFHFN